jgi:hypothetical protein
MEDAMREYERLREALEVEVAEFAVGNEFAIAPGLEQPTGGVEDARESLDAYVRGLEQEVERPRAVTARLLDRSQRLASLENTEDSWRNHNTLLNEWLAARKEDGHE